MQERSLLWEAYARDDFIMESVAVIGSTTYSLTTPPRIQRALFQGSPSVGNCSAASLQISILTDDTIAKGAEAEIKKRLYREQGGEHTEWISAGTFYISKRSMDYSSDLLTLECYDAMQKANQPYIADEGTIVSGDWPKSMADAVDEIADMMGVDVDPRTVIRTESRYSIPVPIGYTCLEVLGFIGACHGGNWIISPEGKLRLVPLGGYTPPDSSGDIPSDAVEVKLTDSSVVKIGGITLRDGEGEYTYGSDANWWTENDGYLEINGDAGTSEVDTVAVIGRLGNGQLLTISRVTMTVDTDDGEISYTAGSDGGYELRIESNPYAAQDICDDLEDTLGGLTYKPYEMTSALYDPAAELGDTIRYYNLVESIIISTDEVYDIAFRATVSAPADEDAEDEFPYKTKEERAMEQAKSAISEARKQAINYLAADSSGIMVANMTNGNRYTPSTVPSGVKNTFIDNSAFQVRDGTSILASYGTTIYIGDPQGKSLSLSPNDMRINGPDGEGTLKLKHVAVTLAHSDGTEETDYGILIENQSGDSYIHIIPTPVQSALGQSYYNANMFSYLWGTDDGQMQLANYFKVELNSGGLLRLYRTQLYVGVDLDAASGSVDADLYDLIDSMNWAVWS